jgi:hypothetical protein
MRKYMREYGSVEVPQTLAPVGRVGGTSMPLHVDKV